MRCGTVALVGRTNVGKSTFLNAVLGERLAIVSPRPQTTRDALLGVVHREDAQIGFLDTPGLHRPRSELGKRMNAVARDALRSADVVVLMTDVVRLTRERPGAVALDPEDAAILDQVSAGTPCIVVVNKVDLLRDKSRMLPLLEALGDRRELAALLPVSCLEASDVERVLREIEPLLPHAPAAWAADTLTDRPVRWLAAELVREQVLLAARSEVPHAVAVEVERWDESRPVVVVQATVHVEKPGQRVILIGRGGARLKEIGTAARKRIEELVGRRVHLGLHVRVSPRWRDVPRRLAELGWERAPQGDLPRRRGRAP